MHPSIYLSPIHLSSIKPSTHTSTHLPSIRLHIHPHPAYPLILPLCIYASLTHSRIHLPHPSLAYQPTPPPTPPSLIHLPIHPFVHLPIYLYISSEPPDGLFQTWCFWVPNTLAMCLSSTIYVSYQSIACPSMHPFINIIVLCICITLITLANIYY